MLRPVKTRQFGKDEEKSRRQGRDFGALIEVIRKLTEEKPLEAKYCDHPLKGEWKGFRDCHIQNDWVLIYKINKAEKTILNVQSRDSCHSDLFTQVDILNGVQDLNPVFHWLLEGLAT